jgi:hypothetical protein
MLIDFLVDGAEGLSSVLILREDEEPIRERMLLKNLMGKPKARSSGDSESVEGDSSDLGTTHSTRTDSGVGVIT